MPVKNISKTHEKENLCRFCLVVLIKLLIFAKNLESLVIWNREKKKTNRIIVNLINWRELMEKRVTMLLASMALSTAMAMAQTKVSGTILTAEGDPVVGASVLVVGTKTGTVTDVDGHYSWTENQDRQG